MNPKIRMLFLIVTSLVITGCISSKSFIDPSFPKVAYEDLKKKKEPLPLRLVVEFQRNGEPYHIADTMLRNIAERILQDSSVVTPVADASQGEVKIVVNNIIDRVNVFAKGFGTGLTLGLTGTTVTDTYELSIFITANGKTISRTAIKHALHTAIGDTSVPPGVETVSPGVAFERVLEQMLLRALKEMQQSGELSWVGLPGAPYLIGHYRWLTIHDVNSDIILDTFPLAAVDGMAIIGFPSLDRAAPRIKSICPPMPEYILCPNESAYTCPVRSTSRAELIATILSFMRIRAVSLVRSQG